MFEENWIREKKQKKKRTKLERGGRGVKLARASSGAYCVGPVVIELKNEDIEKVKVCDVLDTKENSPD